MHDPAHAAWAVFCGFTAGLLTMHSWHYYRQNNR
jgi:hypothetical protein